MKRTPLTVALAALGLSVLAQDNPDRKKSSEVLFREAFRLETEEPIDLAQAIAKYKKAVDRAQKELEGARDGETQKRIQTTAAQALVRTGYCNEKLEPENIAEAQAAYGQVVAHYADVERWGQEARDKVARKGVDVHLQRMSSVIREWQITADRSPVGIQEKLNATWQKIKELDKDATAGLLWGLGRPEEVVRTFSSGKLAEVVDEAGIAVILSKLADANPDVRSGASLALQRIFQKWNEARELDESANRLQSETESVSRTNATDKGIQSIDKLKPRIEDLRKKAAEIRHNIPEKLDGPQIQAELARIVEDENLDPQPRLEAAHAMGGVGLINEALANALMAGMRSRDRNVRQACCRAAGSVDTAVSAAKHKIADLLITIVRYEPAKPMTDGRKPPSGEDQDHPDWSNDAVVRQAACESLERIAIIKSLPALIEALDDNDARVRTAAGHALHGITARDFGFEPDKPLKERQDAQQKWLQWWRDTSGIVVLVERFRKFQAQWNSFSAVKLFDREAFLEEIRSRLWASPDPKADLDRATQVVDAFKRQKDVFVQDAVDIGPGALDGLLKFIGGETEEGGGKADVPTSYFVAEACARIVLQHDVGEGVGKIREPLSGGSAARKRGAAVSLGFLGRDKLGAAEREALVRSLGEADPEIRAASAASLGRVGTQSEAGDLAKAAMDTEVRVQVAALQALTLLAPKSNPDVLKTLLDLVADEPDPSSGRPTRKSPEPVVRERAINALGAIGNPETMDPGLLRGARDDSRVVMEAAKIAIRKVYEASAQEAAGKLVAAFRDEDRKTYDRVGAARALGYAGDGKNARVLVRKLVDESPPKVLRDQDPGVRIAICEALEHLKTPTLTVVEKLLYSMSDESEREAVRDAAHKALKAIYKSLKNEEEPAGGAFKASDPKEKREPAIKAWMDWFNVERDNLKDEF